MTHLIAAMTQQARTQLAQAIERGDLVEVERLLTSGQQVGDLHGLGHAVQQNRDVVVVGGSDDAATSRALNEEHLEV